MLDVTKYVGGLTDANGKVKTDAYAEMSKDILDLSTQIPYTAKELTRLVAAAGQSGKSMDDLISGGFLKDVAEMGTAMDISADQAGDWAAKWEVAFNVNHDQVMELADQINYLGAHYATTAAEIAQTVNDTGSLGQIAGMDVQSTAALSTALLAMGVDSGKVATSIRRMYTNLSMGSKATDAQSAAFEQLGFTAEQFAKDMQKDAPAALKSLFTAIGTQPKDKQVGYLKTLLGQWAIESGAKLTGNLDLFVKTLDDVGDASKYNGSMYKEFMLKCETSESVLTMLGSAWRAVRIEVGNNFLPVLKDVAGFGIEKLNDLRAALPDIAERVRQVIEYLLNNGDKVATTIAGIGTAWAGMRFAPQILQVVSSATKFASGAASPVGLVQKGVSGAGKAGNLWQAAKLGTQLANSAVPAGSNPSFGQRVQNTILGSVLGMQNSKKLFGAKTPAGMAKATSALFGSIQQAQASGGIIGLLKGSSIGQYGARVARSAKNLAGTDFILKVFLMAFPEWLACIFMVVGLVVTALAAVRLGYGLVVAKTVYKWIVNAEEKFGSGAGAEKKAHVIAVLRGYTPDWLDWAINERTLDWIVQLVFDFTKKKLEDYMAKKSAETTTVAHFGNVGENKRND